MDGHAAVIVGGMAISFAGRKLRKKAAADRLSAQSEARSNARQGVTDTFDSLERIISEDFARILAQAAHERLGADVAQALALRRVAKAATEAADELSYSMERIPDVEDATRLLASVAKAVQWRRFGSEATADRLMWLGENWCTDPEGLEEVGNSTFAGRLTERPAADVDEDRVEVLKSRVRAVADAAALVPTPGSGAEWANTTLVDLAADTEALSELIPLWTRAHSAAPRIVVAGDYSTGKSSFIKRLLIDKEHAVPERLGVAAHPQTASAEVFNWGDCELVDTPGFQSAHAGHARAARDAVVGASVVIVLFNPNLVVGAAGDLVTLLFGDPSEGLIGKLPRTIFVINRSDELGIDPGENISGYKNLCARKERELTQALGALQGTAHADQRGISTEQILCVASDPYGSIGDRAEVHAADYDDHRSWDGMDALRIGLTDATAALMESSADAQILEGSAEILGQVVFARREHIAVLETAVAQRRRFLLDLDSCLSAGQALRAAARNRLVSTFAGFVARLFDDVGMAQHDAAAQAARVQRLEEWLSDPELQQLYTEWVDRFVREQDEWQEATSARIEARLASAAFTQAVPECGSVLDVDHLRPTEKPIIADEAVDGAKQLAKEAAKGMANASRESVTKVAHQVGVKFRPWGATKLTAKVNAIGGGAAGALGLGFGAWEIYSVWRSAQQEGDAEQDANERRSSSLREVRDFTRAFFDGTEPDAPGIPMAESLDHVRRYRDGQADNLDRDLAEAARLAEQVERCENRMHDAVERMERVDR